MFVQGNLSKITDNLSQRKTDKIVELDNYMSCKSFYTHFPVIQPGIFEISGQFRILTKSGSEFL